MPKNFSVSYYNPSIRAQATNITIPEKLKCSVCHKFKSQPNFSNKNLDEAREQVRTKGQNALADVSLRCRTCTGTPASTLFCNGCNKTKDIEDFSKIQRRNPDHAICQKCMVKQLNLEPVEDNNDDDNHHLVDFGSDGEDDDLSLVGDDDFYPLNDSSLGSELGALSLSDSGFDTESITSLSAGSSSGGGVPLPNKQNELLADGWGLKPARKYGSHSGTSSGLTFAGGSKSVLTARSGAISNTPNMTPTLKPLQIESENGWSTAGRHSTSQASTFVSQTRGNGKWAKVPKVQTRPEIDDEEDEEEDDDDNNNDDWGNVKKYAPDSDSDDDDEDD